MSYPHTPAGNNDAAGRHRCPNSQCNQLFVSIDAVCAHLSVPGSTCANWTQDFVHNLLHRDTVQHVEHDLDDYGEK
jgi:hypothetical protein